MYLLNNVWLKSLFLCSLHPMFYCCSVLSVQLFAPPWTTAHQASLSFTISRSLLKLMSIESVMPSNNLILCCLFLLLPSSFPSIRVFSNEFVLPIRWLEFWEFQLQLQHQSFQWIFMVDFLEDWLVSSCSARDSLESSPAPQFRIRINSLALSLLYSPTVISVHATGKTIALTRQTFVSKGLCFLICYLGWS